MSFQKNSDNFFSAVFFWALPNHVRPNHLTLLRLALVPFLVHFLIIESYTVAVVLFVVGNITDALDGAMARKRNQETEIGKLFDPISDRFLILTTALVLVWRFISLKLFVVILVLEFFQIYKASKLRDKLKRPIPANWSGKIKMIIHFLALTALLFGAVFEVSVLIKISEIGLYLSLPFLIAEPFMYHPNKIPESPSLEFWNKPSDK